MAGEKADRDPTFWSTIAGRELPRGRSPIATHLVRNRTQALRDAMDHIGREVSAGRQAFVVCPRIGDEEPAKDEEGKRPPLSVVDVLDGLRQHYLPGLRSVRGDYWSSITAGEWMRAA